MTTWVDIEARIQGVSHVTSYTLYTCAGAGGPWNTGYGFDIGYQLEQAGLVELVPVAYGPDGIPGAFPMQPSIDDGIARLKAAIRSRPPSRPFALAVYSEGAIVGSEVYDAIRSGDMQDYKDSFLGAVAFGNPRREAGHTVPNGIDPGGHGIVTPNLVNTEVKWYDFAAGKNMVASPGLDLYTTCGAGESELAAVDQEKIWEIVRTASFTSFIGLAEQVMKILPSPIDGGLGAVEAALSAMGFFGKGLTPHTEYQNTQPVAGDPRSCWDMAYDYLASLAAHPVAIQEDTNMTAPAAPALDLGSIENELKVAVDGLLKGLRFVQKFEAVLPSQYRGVLDTAVKVLAVVDGIL